MSTNGNGKAVARVQQVRSLLEDRREEFAKALAGRVDPDAFVRVAYATVTKTPKLMEATPASLLMALLECASLGLVPNSVMGEAYIVPFNNKVKRNGRDEWEVQAQFIPGYRGLVKLARQSGLVTNIVARPARDGDRFEVIHGTEEKLVHVPLMTSERREATHFYAVAFFHDAPPQFEVMAKWEIERIKARTKTKTKEGKFYGPWVDDYDEMSRKTVVRRIAKYLPLSDNDFSRAMEADNRSFDMSGSMAAGSPVAELNHALDDEAPVVDAEIVGEPEEPRPPMTEEEEYEAAMAARDAGELNL